MKVFAVLGSRNPNGQTARATNALLQGMASAGSEIEKVFLTEVEIERCRQCEESGWGLCRTEGQCTIEDDFAGLVDKLLEADVVVFATPVYFGDLSESMRAFLDRLRRTCIHEGSEDRFSDKPALGICVAGGGGGGAPGCVVSLEKVLSRCEFDVVDLVPVRRQNLAMKLDILQTTGTWLADYASSGGQA